MRILAVLILTFGIASADAKDCWKDVMPGHHSQELRCLYEEWSLIPTRDNLKKILTPLFYVYVTDASHPAMRQFFDGMRSHDFRFRDALQWKSELIRKYTFGDFAAIESSSIWAMQPRDARNLFILTQTDPYSVPREITYAMYLAIYDELERYFYLGPPHRNFMSIFPETEYTRLLEILTRMDWLKDPFMHATNLYYRSLVQLNLGRFQESRESALQCHVLLESHLGQVSETLARRRILHGMAVVNLLLGRVLEAESNYVSILKMDPEDWNAIMQLSYLMNRRGECDEPAIWIEASLRSDQEFFEVIIHCGRKETPVEDFPTGPPVIARIHDRVPETVPLY